jgi:PRTRC genetic system ThiF family protein
MTRKAPSKRTSFTKEVAIKKMSDLDTSYLDAATLMVRGFSEVSLFLVGCGGTGSWLAPVISRLVKILKEKGLKASAVFIDPDIVEHSNLTRQHFCLAEVGLPKAQTLAVRYSNAWGADVSAINAPFDSKAIDNRYDKLIVVIGCVDNAAARKEMARVLENNYQGQAPSIFYLDCGNSKDSGQVIIGTADTIAKMRGAFISPKLCGSLPSPVLQHPELLSPQPEELLDHNLSCEELMIRNTQSLMINQRVAAEAGDFLSRLLITQNLKRYATYFDLPTGTCKSSYIIASSISHLIGKSASYLSPSEKSSKRAGIAA